MDAGESGVPDAGAGGDTNDGGRGGRTHSPPDPSFGGSAPGSGGPGGAAGDLGTDPIPMAGQSGEPSPDTVAPDIVSVSPSDGESGVRADAVIVITFTEAMDRAATEAAFASAAPALASPTFTWNGAGTRLTVEPGQPLPYAEIEALDEPPATIAFELVAGASDLAGNLLAPRAFTFSTLRRYAEELAPLDALSGSVRSDGRPGLGDCAPGKNTICVGDSYYQDEFVQYKGFVAFPFEAPADAAELEAAVLRIRVRNTAETTDGAVIDDPFGELGPLLVDPVRYSALDDAAFDAAALAEPQVFANAATPGATLTGAIPAILDAEALAHGSLQFRLAFELENNGVPNANAVVFDAPSSRLDLTYLLP